MSEEHLGGSIREGIWETTRPLRNIWDLEDIWEDLGGIWETSGSHLEHLGPGIILEATRVKTSVFLSVKVARATISRRRDDSKCHQEIFF